MSDESQLTRLDVSQIKLFSNSHAIEDATFGVSFLEPIGDADVFRFREKEDELRRLFPAINDVQGFEVSLGRNVPSLRESAPAKQLLEFDRGGRIVWAAEFIESRVSVSSKQYTRWAAVWSDAKPRLLSLLSLLDRKRQVVSVDLIVTDTFSIAGGRGIFPSDLLDEGSDFASSRILSVRDGRWDFQTGWFESHGVTEEMLVRLDMRSVRDGSGFTVNIVNHFSLRPKSRARRLDEWLDGSEENFESAFNRFHSQNKSILTSSLKREITSRMGL